MKTKINIKNKRFSFLGIKLEKFDEFTINENGKKYSFKADPLTAELN